MPIEVFAPIKPLGQEEFHALDRRVMAVAFAVHNDLGRLLDEAVYKQEILVRCSELGILPAEREVRIRVSYEDFAKEYFMDLLFGCGVMLEAKTADAISPAHRSQAVNYLLLTGMNHGRLANLRPDRVEHEFISTRLTPQARRQFVVQDQEWHEVNEPSRFFKNRFIAILREWGAFLDLNLYREATVHFLGGAERVCRNIELLDGTRSVGVQSMNLLSDDTAFVISTFPSGASRMSVHLRRLLQHTRLSHIQWVNIHHHTVEFATLSLSH